jgi:hypothetical protein
MLHGPRDERRYRSSNLHVAGCVKGLFCVPRVRVLAVHLGDWRQVDPSIISDNGVCRLRVNRKNYRKYF